MSDVIVLGSSNMDFVLRVDRLPEPGETIRGSAFMQELGGKGANQAVAAARAGADVTFIAAIGDGPLGRQCILRHKHDGLDLKHLRLVQGMEAGVAMILVDGKGQNVIAIYPGANATYRPEYIAELPNSLFESAWVFVTQLEIPAASVEAGLKRAQSHGVLTILNPAPATVPEAIKPMLRYADVLIPNETEAHALVGQKIRSLDSAKTAARKMLKWGCRSVVLTLGSAGCIVALTGEKGKAERMMHVPGLPANAIDTTAAGDCFIGAFAMILARQMRLAECSCNFEFLCAAAKWGNAAAALSVERDGAQLSLPYEWEILQKLEESQKKGRKKKRA